jgi:endo-1,4-beta-xylanase
MFTVLLKLLRIPSLVIVLLAVAGVLPAQTTLRQAGAQRALLTGAAADADEFGEANPLKNPSYAATLSAQYSMLEPENAMKWNPIHPAQNTYNFEPADQLVAFAQANQMQVRGHNLCWYNFNPTWVTALAASATPAAMSALLQSHIATVVGHYKGQVFAWDVVNEAMSDTATSGLRDSIWYNQPGIGLSGTGYVEQAFRWAHDADPAALLFYNEYNIEAPGAKFTAVYNMVKDFVSRGVPIHGVGIQMHIDTTGYPNTAGLTQNIQQLTALGLQVHITEMDVRLPVDANGIATTANLQAQSQTYQRILTVCLQNPGCTAFQTWGFTDAYSWIPGSYPGFGAALPFDLNYQPKPAVSGMLNTLQTVPAVLSASGIVNAASYQGGGVAPGELVTIFGANYGPAPLLGAQLDSNHLVSSNLGGTRVLFDGVAAPLIYAAAGQVSAVVPYEVAGKTQTVVQYEYNGVPSNTVTVPVLSAAPGIFAVNASGSGSAVALGPESGGVIAILATGGGTISGGAVDGALAPGAGTQALSVTATIAGLNAPVIYAGPAPGLVNGVMQLNLTVPAGLAPGPQPVVLTIAGVSSQPNLTVTVQ